MDSRYPIKLSTSFSGMINDIDSCLFFLVSYFIPLIIKFIKERLSAIGNPLEAIKKKHKDIDARWTKKKRETFYGYKNHAKVDTKRKFINTY